MSLVTKGLGTARGVAAGTRASYELPVEVVDISTECEVVET
jgi:hypothetical protein